MFTSNDQLQSILLAAAVLALLTAGCAEGPAGGATPRPVAPAKPAIQATLSEVKPPPAAESKPAAPNNSSADPVVPARLTSAVPVVAVSERGASGQTRDITFDTIKFNMDKKEPFKRELITPQIEALAGQTVRIRGYILPSFKQHGLTQFILVRDNLECCFGPGAALYDCVVVEMEPGKATEFSVRPVAVEGVFSIQILPGPTDDRPLAIYHLYGTSVK